MSDARRFFDAIARRYDRVYALSGADSRARLATVLDIIRGKERVLVLGIGTGRELPALLDGGHTVTGIDISPEMIAQYNRRSRVAPVTLGDFWEPLPFQDGSFDAALALHGTIAHPPGVPGVPGVLTALARELARVLTKGGVFVAEVPVAAGLARLAAEAGGRSFAATSPTTFVHRDDAAGAEIAGVALTAEGWREALGSSLVVETRPLGDVELLLVGRA